MIDMQVASQAYEVMTESCRGAEEILTRYGLSGKLSFYQPKSRFKEDKYFDWKEPAVIQFGSEKMDITHVGKPRDADGPDSIEAVTKRIVLKVLHHKVAVAEGMKVIGDGSKYDLRDVDVNIDNVDGKLCIDEVPILYKDQLIILSNMMRTDTVHRVHILAGQILVFYDEELKRVTDKSFYVDMRQKVHFEGYDCYRCDRSLDAFKEVEEEVNDSLKVLIESMDHYDLSADLHADNFDGQILEYKERLKLV